MADKHDVDNCSVCDEINAMTRKCPHCGAAAGEWCVTFRGSTANRLHKRRLRNRG